jgi:hypothetical protein
MALFLQKLGEEIFKPGMKYRGGRLVQCYVSLQVIDNAIPLDHFV